jgi:predicted phage terminase large subunit-like protein
MTRWHPDDLAGRLISQDKLGGDKWEVISLPAIAEDNDPIGRKVGQALWEDRYNIGILQDRKKQVGEFWFRSMYQQQPYFKGGRVFADANYFVNEPVGGILGVSVDFAYSRKSYSDYSVIGVGKWFNKKLYLIDWWRGQVDATQFASILKKYQLKYDSPIYTNIGGTERGIVDFLKKEHNLRILEKPATTDKFSRAQPVSAAWNDGRVLLPENTKWTEPLVHEVASFTGVNDVHDDQVDVLSTLYNSLNRSQKPLWRIS